MQTNLIPFLTAQTSNAPQRHVHDLMKMSDPRNKGIEHFNGHTSEDNRRFKVWQTKAFNYM